MASVSAMAEWLPSCFINLSNLNTGLPESDIGVSITSGLINFDNAGTWTGNCNIITTTSQNHYLKPSSVAAHNVTNLFILYGCSHIKNNLFNYLYKKKTICIHMGVLPYYKGTDCNFWALYDKNIQLVGSTVMKISKNFEEGKILYYAFPHYAKNPLEYSMLASKAAFVSIVKKIKNKSIFRIKPFRQYKKLEIRETKKSQFNEKIVKRFSSKY